ncbi:MAG: nuclear transport factor 2 family protein [Dehalococcoidales bacterium]|nr:MAG: nuclear transport factor 2 family protein [Dehalococcoidales bacterium]
MGIEENKDVIYQLWEAYNQGDLESLAQYLSDDFTRYAHDGATMDKESYIKFCGWIIENSSDSKIVVDDMVAENDKVAFRMTLSGSSEGKVLSVKEAYFARIEEGKIVDFYNIHSAPIEHE